jgi:ATP-dependent Clp protease ATP-binding subunit ClpA
MSITPVPSILSKELDQQSDFSRLKNLEARLNQELFDQPEAIRCVAELIKRIKVGFYDERKPRGVLVFAGPTGVGKTELAKITAFEMGIPLIRFDMSEFSEPHKVSRFLGAPSGYIDSDRGGELVNKLKRTPDCVVLFDEIEKAHPNVYKIFLQLFDDGHLTDSIGQEVDATKAIFILTTNLGSHEIYQQMQKGTRDNLDERLKVLCMRTFSAELYNRFDKVVIFRHLSQSAVRRIVEKYLKHLKDNFAKRKIDITWDQSVVVHLSAFTMDVTMGARDVHRKINDYLLPKFAESRIEGKILQTNVKVHMGIVNEKIELIILDKGKVAIIPQNEQKLFIKEKKLRP